jgi:hypothetical protein
MNLMCSSLRGADATKQSILACGMDRFAYARNDVVGCSKNESMTRTTLSRHRPARPGDPVIASARD